jgi:hypothetical protein
VSDRETDIETYRYIYIERERAREIEKEINSRAHTLAMTVSTSSSGCSHTLAALCAFPEPSCTLMNPPQPSFNLEPSCPQNLKPQPLNPQS